MSGLGSNRGIVYENKILLSRVQGAGCSIFSVLPLAGRQARIIIIILCVTAKSTTKSSDIFIQA